MPRYVILEHDHPHLHWDFMLKTGDALTTWRLSKKPIADVSLKLDQKECDTNHSISAERLADHRKEYLDYEGPVSGDRGTVKQWDFGLYHLLGSTETQWEVRLEGHRLSGFATIWQDAQAANWTFRFLAD